jgi:NTP pyrophosphatase (non-canonical NTP hydrolase)
MTRDECLILLIEECGEVIQAATKCLRFGWDRNHPNYGVNHEVLAEEIGDLLGVADALPLRPEVVQVFRRKKMRKAEQIKAEVEAEAINVGTWKNDAPPRARDPLALAGVTVQAVDQIGESAAHEIEEAAAAVELAAGEIGTKLRKLAAAVREHSKIAGEQVADFVNRSTNVIETIRALQERLDAGEPKKGNGGDV